jgi:P pilus assembly chaperone PapD
MKRSRTMIRRRTVSLLAGLCALLAGATFAQAMSISPTHIEMTSLGPDSRADIRVFNGSDKPLPIETVISRVTHGAEGNKIVRRNEADFLVLPMQAMIPPGGSQTLKVQWLGEPLIEESRAYRLHINQLPVAQPGQGKAVRIVLSFAVIVNVAPPEGQPNLQLVKTGITRSRAGKRVPTLTVTNRSKVHARLPEARIHLSSGSWSRVLSPGVLEGLIGIGTVMPGQTRTFEIPLTLPENVGSVEARLDYQERARR